MASKKILFGSKPSYIYPAKEFDYANDLIISRSSDHQNIFEFDEEDIWNNSNEASMDFQDGKKPLPSSRASSNKHSRKMEAISVNHKTPNIASASLPVNIPDWSKILKAEYREHGGDEDVGDVEGDSDDDGDDGASNGRIPPHEYLARRRGDSFSVLEGIGRTLKGRDLRCVRNAIWKNIGFED